MPILRLRVREKEKVENPWCSAFQINLKQFILRWLMLNTALFSRPCMWLFPVASFLHQCEKYTWKRFESFYKSLNVILYTLTTIIITTEFKSFFRLFTSLTFTNLFGKVILCNTKSKLLKHFRISIFIDLHLE